MGVCSRVFVKVYEQRKVVVPDPICERYRCPLADDVRSLKCVVGLLLDFIVCSRSIFLLVAHADESRTQPHHQLRPRTMRLLLDNPRASTATATTSPSLLHLLESLSRKRRRLQRRLIIAATNQTIRLLAHHGEIRFAAFAARRSIAGRGTTMTPLEMPRLLLGTLLESADLLARGLLFLGQLFLLEFAACFLDCFAARAGVDLAAAADAEAFVHAGAHAGDGGDGVGR